MDYSKQIKEFFKGEVLQDEATLATYSVDTSLINVRPKLVVFPKDTEDIKNLVRFVNEHRKEDPTLSITVRAAGTDMSGGPLNESIIADVSKHISGVPSVNTVTRTVKVLPGTFYRDFEKETFKHGLLLPCYPASKNLCAIGGMIGNNCAGEKTLVYGKMEDYIESLKVVFADGNEYEVRPLSRDELQRKMSQGDFEGDVYKKIYELIEQNKEAIMAAKPKVKKNSSGLYLWNVWQGEKFNLCRLIVGSQGTLGIVTEATLNLVPTKKHSLLYVIFLNDLKPVAPLVNELLKFQPESLESYDDHTLKLAIRFLPGIWKSMKAKNFLKFILSFLPEVGMVLTGGLPKLVVLAEFAGNDKDQLEETLKKVEEQIKKFHLKTHITRSPEEASKYWTIRRESFNLLRQHVHGRRTAAFIDDIVVNPEHLPEFWPKLMKLLDDYKLVYTVAGHAGSGNFHVIPLMDMKKEENHKIVIELSEKVYDLVLAYGGSITAEHNDGIIRTPYLKKMFGEKILALFQETNLIFDPLDIFNPGKKGAREIKYLKQHLVYI
ncbi:MAG: FAD-binding oxidoreductase [Patescibacteria group bacterium]|nr:FAD-binding oxidoreductase [bacterium]MDZ4240827.1 FAD-binding oxidoreductase [Patescibacteria group bacterium]